MKFNSTPARMYLASVIVLLGGLGGSVLIYVTAGNAPDGGMVDDFLNSKQYAHDLKAYGGNAIVLADEFSRWFEALWHGTELAYTIAAIALFVSFAVFYVGWHLPSETECDAEADCRQGEPTEDFTGSTGCGYGGETGTDEGKGIPSAENQWP